MKKFLILLCLCLGALRSARALEIFPFTDPESGQKVVLVSQFQPPGKVLMIIYRDDIRTEWQLVSFVGPASTGQWWAVLYDGSNPTGYFSYILF